MIEYILAFLVAFILIFLGIVVIDSVIKDTIHHMQEEKREKDEIRKKYFSSDLEKSGKHVSPINSENPYESGTDSGLSYSESENLSKRRSYKLSEEKKDHVEITIYKYTGNDKWRCSYCDVENDYDRRKCVVCGKERT